MYSYLENTHLDHDLCNPKAQLVKHPDYAQNAPQEMLDESLTVFRFLVTAMFDTGGIASVSGAAEL
jgi:hypothetical protein